MLACARCWISFKHGRIRREGARAKRGKRTHEHEVDDTLLVDVGPKVLVVTSREARSDPVVRVHHARHAIETEAVELKLLHVKAEVGEEEPKDFVRAVVEETTASIIVRGFKERKGRRGRTNPRARVSPWGPSGSTGCRFRRSGSGRQNR